MRLLFYYPYLFHIDKTSVISTLYSYSYLYLYVKYENKYEKSPVQFGSDLFPLPRWSSAVSPTRPPAALFFYPMTLFGPAASPVPRFCPDLAFIHPESPGHPLLFEARSGTTDKTKTRETSSGSVVSATERIVSHHLFRFPPKCAAYAHFPRRIPPQL
jgi:hypothetical protein